MTLKVRRVVTGHDRNGRAVVQIDDIPDRAVSMRSGHSGAVIWTTEGFPVDNSGDGDASMRPVATSEDNGSVFRVVRYEPGVAPRMHRTHSIDYAVVISGEIDMQLDGSEVRLQAGDVLVQRGTVHNWVNRGTEPCLIAFALIGAKPVSAGGKVLGAKN
jgi:quercetin dioxygenase-like cupin family protein